MLFRRLYNSSLFRSSGIYTAANIINAAIPLAMVPILTRYLTPADYGIVAMFFVLVGIVSPFVGLNIHGAISVKFFDRDNIDLPTYIGNCFLILCFSSITVLLFITFFAQQISRQSSFPGQWLWTILFVSTGQFIISILMIMWQVQNKPFLYGTFQISQTLINLSLSLILVVGLNKNWQGRVEAQVITVTIFAILSFAVLYKKGWIKFSYNKTYVQSALAFGIPLVPHALGGWTIDMADRFFVTKYAGISSTGIYSVGYQIGMIVSIVESSFIQAWVPYFYEQLKADKQEIRIKLVRFTYLYFIALIAMALGLALLAPFLMRTFVGKSFEGAHIYVVWIALGYAFNGMCKMMSGYIFYIQKTSVLAIITFISAALSLIITYILTKHYGAIGAAYATTISFVLTFILTWWLSNKLYKMPWFDPAILKTTT